MSGLYSEVLTVQKVSYFLHVDLEVGNLDVHLYIHVHVVELVKHVHHDTRDDPLHVLTLQVTLGSQGGEGEFTINFIPI